MSGKRQVPPPPERGARRRRVETGMKIFLKFLLPVLLALALAPLALAGDAGKMRKALDLIRARRYADAVPKMNELYLNSAEYSNEALFHIIYCQTRLGQADLAYSNIQYLKPEKLASNQRAFLDKLKEDYAGRNRALMAKALELVKKRRWEEAIVKLDYLYWRSAELYNKVLFYIVYCQDKLYKVGEAQANIGKLNVKFLKPEERSYIERLRKKPVPAYKTAFFTPEFHAGGLAYGRKVHFKSGIFSGASASAASLSRSFAVAYDRLEIRKAPANGSGYFRQSQHAAFFGRQLDASWSGRAGYIGLRSDDGNTDGGNIFGLSVKKSAGDSYGLLELNLSSYPEYFSKDLSVRQYSLGAGAHLADPGLDSSVYGEMKAILIYPKYPDNSTNAFFNKASVSLDLAVRFYSYPHQLSCGAWAGKQIFAVRDGSVPYNVADRHAGGARLAYSFLPSAGAQLTVFGAVEKTVVEDLNVTSYSYGASLSLFL